MFRTLYKICLTLFPLISYGQQDDSSNYARKNKVRFVFSFDGRKSFIGDQNVSIGGLRFGIQYKEKFRTGIGFYGADSPLIGSKSFNENTPKERRLRGKLNFGYSALCFEPIFYKNRKWELATPIILGVGNAKLTFYNPDSTIFSENEKPFSLLEVSGTVEYKFLKWAGVGAGVGYRTVFSDEKFIKRNFDAPIYIIKIKVFIGELYRGIRRNVKAKNARKLEQKTD
ncbi:MAG TPA: hypothetical protein VF691_14985 [Cytophagaceae bacterium]|jgi:hypothetical protein